MELNQKKNHMIDSVFVICLLLLFLISALSVIAIGASIYKKNVSLMADNNSHRIATAYVTEKIRQADNNGGIYVQDFFGENALVMTKEVGGITINTYIYDYEGSLMELTARGDMQQLFPQSGQRIMNISSFDIKAVSDNMFRVSIVLPDGTEDVLYITKRSSKKG